MCSNVRQKKKVCVHVCVRRTSLHLMTTWRRPELHRQQRPPLNPPRLWIALALKPQRRRRPKAQEGNRDDLSNRSSSFSQAQEVALLIFVFLVTMYMRNCEREETLTSPVLGWLTLWILEPNLSTCHENRYRNVLTLSASRERAHVSIHAAITQQVEIRNQYPSVA